MAQEGSQGAVYITPIGASDSKEMKVLSMSESSILRMKDGEKVMVYIQPNGPGQVILADPDPISIEALRAFIPAVDQAIANRAATNSSKIAFIVLPDNDLLVYRSLLEWIGICVYCGETIPFRPAPLSLVSPSNFRANTLKMVQQLGLGWVEQRI